MKQEKIRIPMVSRLCQQVVSLVHKENSLVTMSVKTFIHSNAFKCPVKSRQGLIKGLSFWANSDIFSL
jgi:hypothetical protein